MSNNNVGAENYDYVTTCWYCGTELDDSSHESMAKHMAANPDHNQMRVQMYIKGTSPPLERQHARSVLGVHELSPEEVAAANADNPDSSQVADRTQH